MLAQPHGRGGIGPILKQLACAESFDGDGLVTEAPGEVLNLMLEQIEQRLVHAGF